MQRTRAALATVCGGEGCVPARPRLVEPAEAERDLRALLAIALARLSLLDARASRVTQLPPTDHRSGHQILLPNDLDRFAQTADGGSPRMEVIEHLSRLWVFAEEDADLQRTPDDASDEAVTGGGRAPQPAGESRQASTAAHHILILIVLGREQVGVPRVFQRPPVDLIAVL
eukprot:7391543-Prymnesium_polylepis.2